MSQNKIKIHCLRCGISKMLIPTEKPPPTRSGAAARARAVTAVATRQKGPSQPVLPPPRGNNSPGTITSSAARLSPAAEGVHWLPAAPEAFRDTLTYRPQQSHRAPFNELRLLHLWTQPEHHGPPQHSRLHAIKGTTGSSFSLTTIRICSLSDTDFHK